MLANSQPCMDRSMLLLVWEKIKEATLYTLSAVVFVHYIFQKSIEIFGHSWHSLGNALEKP